MASSTVWTHVSLVLNDTARFRARTHETGPHGPYVVVEIEPHIPGYHVIHLPGITVIDRLIAALNEGRAWLADQAPASAAGDRGAQAA